MDARHFPMRKDSLDGRRQTSTVLRKTLSVCQVETWTSLYRSAPNCDPSAAVVVSDNKVQTPTRYTLSVLHQTLSVCQA